MAEGVSNTSGASDSASSAARTLALRGRIERQNAALLGERAGERLDEAALRERHLDGVVSALVPGGVLRDETHHRPSRPP